MPVQVLTAAAALQELEIDRPAISKMLIDLGISLEVPNVAGLILACADVLIAAELAVTLPEEGDYAALLGGLVSMQAVQQSNVRDARLRVLGAAFRVDPDATDLVKSRRETLVAHLSKS